MSDEEITVVQRAGFPVTPVEYKGTYFEQIVTQMATLVDEVRGYRADLTSKAKHDQDNWDSIKNEISGVRGDLERFKGELRREANDAKRESESKIRILEQTVERLSETVTRLEAKLHALETQDPRERTTLVPVPHAGPATKAR